MVGTAGFQNHKLNKSVHMDSKYDIIKQDKGKGENKNDKGIRN